jgi:hypothetical protein
MDDWGKWRLAFAARRNEFGDYRTLLYLESVGVLGLSCAGNQASFYKWPKNSKK